MRIFSFFCKILKIVFIWNNPHLFNLGNFRRREDIRKYWFFDCGCNRCSDRTEFGTNMSAVLCLKCKKGYLLPLDPLEYKSDWTCDYCQTITKYEMIDEIITTIEDEVSGIEFIFNWAKIVYNVKHMIHWYWMDSIHILILNIILLSTPFSCMQKLWIFVYSLSNSSKRVTS